MAKFARTRDRFASRLFLDLAGNEKGSGSVRKAQPLLNWIASDRAFLSIDSYETVGRPIATLAPAAPFLSVAPDAGTCMPLDCRGILPAIQARLFNDAAVCGLSSAILAGNRLAVPSLYVERPEMQISDARFLLQQVDGLAEIATPRSDSLGSGIGVIGAGSTNWYHWLIEILPAAFLAEGLPDKYRDFPLLVPEHARKLATFSDALQLFAGDRRIVPLSNEVPTGIKELVFIDPPVRGPMNMRSGVWPAPKDYSQHEDVMRAYRKAMIDRMALKEAIANRRLFLARGNGLRSYNQDELIAAAASRGFEVIYPETMTFREQAETFLQGEFLIGPSGAAFTNTLFCQPGTRALTWILPQYSGFCAYSNLARIVGMDLHYLFVAPTTEIASTHDAYTASYLLDPGTFGARVDDMLQGRLNPR